MSQNLANVLYPFLLIQYSKDIVIRLIKIIIIIMFNIIDMDDWPPALLASTGASGKLLDLRVGKIKPTHLARRPKLKRVWKKFFHHVKKLLVLKIRHQVSLPKKSPNFRIKRDGLLQGRVNAGLRPEAVFSRL